MKLQHYTLGNTPRTKDYDKQYFDSLICNGGHGHDSHYSVGEKYCTKDEVFLRTQEKFCPKCGCQLRTKNANSNPYARIARAKYLSPVYI